jgi:hypothetical protein
MIYGHNFVHFIFELCHNYQFYTYYMAVFYKLFIIKCVICSIIYLLNVLNYILLFLLLIQLYLCFLMTSSDDLSGFNLGGSAECLFYFNRFSIYYSSHITSKLELQKRINKTLENVPLKGMNSKKNSS